MRLQLLLLCVAAAAQGARMEFTIVDDAGNTVPARVHIAGESGREYSAEGAVTVPIGPDRWFVSDGRVVLDVPEDVRVHVERGPEYVPLRESIRVRGAVRRRLSLRRWTDMRALGYRSGETHLHVPAPDLRAMLAAEDLDFGTSLHWWNYRRLPVPTHAQAIANLAFAGHTAQATLFDAEVENSWGAVYLVGLTQPMPVAWNRKRSNLPFVKHARGEGALIGYQGGYSREVLFDALLGLVDVVNVCNNNFLRFKYQPRGRYSNLLAVPGLPEYPNTPEGMMRMNTDTYYRLLNCGLRLGAGAESATGAKTTPAGYNRAYVRAGANPTVAQFLSAWREGRNFVTNGPMVLLRADGGEQPGNTIRLPEGGGAVRLRAEAFSSQPLRSLEIVVNGRVAGSAALRPGATQTELSLTLDLREGSWISARATGEDRLLSDAEMKRFEQKTELSEEPCRLLFGHTSPIYAAVGGRGARVPASVDEAHRILDGFESWARKNAAPEFLREILDEMPRARKALGPSR